MLCSERRSAPKWRPVLRRPSDRIALERVVGSSSRGKRFRSSNPPEKLIHFNGRGSLKRRTTLPAAHSRPTISINKLIRARRATSIFVTLHSRKAAAAAASLLAIHTHSALCVTTRKLITLLCVSYALTSFPLFIFYLASESERARWPALKIN